jgi:hypothetical protein
VSVLALFIALSGGAYALTIPKESVGAGQLKKNAVTSSKVKNRSLLAKDFKAGQLPVGATGAQGAKGDPGPAGQQGPKGDPGATNVTVRTAAGPAANPGFFSGVTVSCDPGEVATGGGVDRDAGLKGSVVQSSPTPTSGRPTGWSVVMRNDGASGTAATQAYVICASP